MPTFSPRHKVPVRRRKNQSSSSNKTKGVVLYRKGDSGPKKAGNGSFLFTCCFHLFFICAIIYEWRVLRGHSGDFDSILGYFPNITTEEENNETVVSITFDMGKWSSLLTLNTTATTTADNQESTLYEFFSSHSTPFPTQPPSPPITLVAKSQPTAEPTLVITQPPAPAPVLAPPKPAPIPPPLVAETVPAPKAAPIQEQKDKVVEEPLRPKSWVYSANPKEWDLTEAWGDVSPKVASTKFPEYIIDYIKFHNDAITSIQKGTKQAKDFRYLVYSCGRRDDRCSGTAQRQRGILAMAVVAMLTQRILLIDYSKPINLKEVMEPNFIKWTFDVSGLDKLPDTFIYNRVTTTYVLDRPADFMGDQSAQVTKILTAGPHSFMNILASQESIEFFRKYGLSPIMDIKEPLLYKQLFAALYKPSPLVRKQLAETRKALKIDLSSRYVGVHVRYGNEGSTAVVRYDETGIAEFLNVAKQFQTEKTRDGSVPLILVTDDQATKDRMKKMDSSVRVANNEIVHEDRTRLRKISVGHIAAVWADLFLMVESDCLVMSSSEFSMLANRLAMTQTGTTCSVLQKKGWIYEQSRSNHR